MGVNELSLRDLVTISFLLATEIALSRLVPLINTPIAKVSLGFIPIVLIAILYKPTVTIVFCGLADFIGAMLFPIGAYNPAFTITAIVSGAIIGYGFYNKKLTFIRILLTVAIGTIVCSVFINTYWISVFYGKLFYVLLPTRAFTAIGKIIIKVLIIYALQKARVFDRIIKIREKAA